MNVSRRKRVLGRNLALAVALGSALVPAAGNGLPRREAPVTVTAARPAAVTPTSGGDRALGALLRRLTTVDGGAGALVAVRDRHGSSVLTSGTADVESGAPVPRDSRFRIGSFTKPFVATVVLQLVGEHRIALDAPVERYLPGVVRGHGNDGRLTTVRQLLQHTSGLPDVLTYLTPQEILQEPLAHHDTRDLLNIALAHPPAFEPGTGWRYSNTDYLLAGMLIEKVTGHTYGEEIRSRIITPLGLHETYVPGDDPSIPGPHPRGYVRPGGDAPLTDITAVNPSVAGAAGGMISSGTDLDRFLDALLAGRLLRPAQLREMMRTRPTGNPDGRAYGLGLESHPLPCGGLYWGHGGDMLGYQTEDGATVDGRQATVMVNVDPGGTKAQDDDMKAAVQAALCEARSRTSHEGDGPSQQRVERPGGRCGPPRRHLAPAQRHPREARHSRVMDTALQPRKLVQQGFWGSPAAMAQGFALPSCAHATGNNARTVVALGLSAIHVPPCSGNPVFLPRPRLFSITGWGAWI